MPSNPSSPNPNESPPPQSGRRRSSFVDMFSRPAVGAGSTSNPSFPSRRLSISTLGLTALPPGQQSSPFGSNSRARRESDSSGSVDESPFEEDAPTSTGSSASVPSTPFARRMSFGARALRDVRAGGSGSGNGNGNANELDFGESLRARAERTSISGASGTPTSNPSSIQRAKTIPIPEMQKASAPKASRAPDAFQERILKGDFYMD